MNNFTKLFGKAAVMLSLVLSGYATQAQTQIFLEKMGTVTNNTDVPVHEAANGFDNDYLKMSSGTAATVTSVRNTNNLKTDGANDANIWMPSGAERIFEIEDIDASGYTNLIVDFAYRKEKTTGLPNIELSFWNGTAYVPVTYTFAEAANAVAGWYTVTGIQLPAAAQINGLKLRWKKQTGSLEVRLDEIKLSGTAAATTVNPTIASTLNGRANVITGVQETYDVTTTAGSMAGTMVKVKATLANPAQAADMALEYFETLNNTWVPFTFDANGEFIYGPATGFPLADATSNFRVTYSAAGTYTTSLEIVDATTGVALVPAVTESVVVTAPNPVVDPTIASTINGRANVKTTVEENFSVATTTGSFANEMVKVKMTLATPAQASDITILYEATPGNFLPLTFNAAGETEFGPATGFPLANTATNFKITFSAAGIYDYTLAIIDVATGNALATPTAESVTVAAFVNPTIASTLNGRANVVTGVQETYDVTTTAGDMAGTMVKVKATLANPAQAADMDLEYFETLNSTWVPFTFDANGEFIYGPATGFQLADATSNFRVTYTAAGTYTTTLEIIDAVTGVALVPAVTESVVVTAPAPVVLPTIASDLDGRTGVITTVEEDVIVTATAGSFAGQLVKVIMALDTPAQAADIDVAYEATPGNFLPLTFNAAGEAEFGPATGFPLANAATNFKVTFAAAGTYNYILAIIDAATDTLLVPATTESVIVAAFENAEIASDLNGRSGLLTGVENDFSVGVTAGDMAGAIVNIKLHLEDATQASNVVLTYLDATSGTYLPLTFNAKGELTFGPAAGFPLASDTTDFRVIFNAPGTYKYALLITDAANGDTLALTAESVSIIVNGVKDAELARLVNVYPNPTTDVLNIELANNLNAEVRVLDVTGKQVASLKNVAGAAKLSVANLKAGTYFLQIQTAKGVAMKRFVVVR